MNLKQISCLNCRTIAGLAKDPFYRTSFFMAFTSVFNSGCGFIFWIIAARLYTIEQVGLATALMSSLGLVILFSRLGFDSSIYRFLPSEDKGKVISTSLTVTTVACIMAGLIYILLTQILAPSMLFLREPEFALAFLLIGAVNSVAAIVQSASVATRKAYHYFLQNLFMALRIPALLSFAFLGVFGIFGSVGFGFLVASCFGMMTLHRSVGAIKPQLDMEYIRRSFRFSSWNYVSNILSAVDTMIIPLMVLNMLGAAEAARYYIAIMIFNLVLIIPGSFGTSLFVEGSHGEGLRRSVLRAGGASIALMVPAALVLLLFGDRLLGLLKGEYVEAFGLLRIFVLSSFLELVYLLFIPIQNVRMRVESIVTLNALRCALMLGLSYVLMQRYGILGAGYAFMATFGIISLVVGWVAWREEWIK